MKPKTKIKYILVLLLYVLFIRTYAQQMDTTIYYITYGDYSIEEFSEIQPTFDNGYIAVGTTSSTSNTASDVYVVKLDSLFQKQWSKSFGSTFLENGKSIIQTRDSNFVFCGYTNKTQNGDYDIWVEKIDRQGNFIWEQFIGGNDWDFGYQIIELPDSSLVIAGTTYSFGNNADGYIVRLDKSGNILWEKNTGSNAREELYSLTLNLKNDQIIAVGESDKNFATDSTDIYFVKLDTAGNILVDTTYGGIKFDNARQVAATYDSAFVTMGSTNSQYLADLDYYAVKIDKNNTVAWEFTGGHNGNYDNDETGICIATKGQKLLFGINTLTYGAGGSDIIIVALDNSGAWLNLSNTFGLLEDEQVNDIVFSNGHYIAAGKTNSVGFGQDDALIIYKDTLIPSNTYNIQNIKDTILTGISNVSYQSKKITLYPNPVKDIITFRNLPTSIPFVYFIYNNAGQLVDKGNIYHNSTGFIDLNSGNYYIRLCNLSGKQVYLFKFIKQ